MAKHQPRCPVMTTAAGVPVADNQNTLTAGPRGPVRSYHRDGHMRFDGNGGASPVYQPNSFAGPVEDPGVKEPPLRIRDDADRHDHWAGNEDYWTQAGDLYRLMGAEEKQRLVANIAGAMQGVPRAIQVRQLRHFYKADPAYGEGVARRLGIDVAEVKAA